MTAVRMAAAAALMALAACGGPKGDAAHSYGTAPVLPQPSGGLPTIHAARAVGWPAGGAPVGPAGFTVTRFAEGLSHPRWLYVMPDGGVLAAESSTQAEQGGGIVGAIRNMVQRRAGAIGDGPNRITLLTDTDQDGRADQRSVFVENLNQPFGMALVGDHFYVGDTDAVVRFSYTAGAVRLAGQPRMVLSLPHREGDNGHWTRNLIARADGSKLYVAVGSSSNVADYGIEAEAGRAAIWEFNPDGSQARMFATGLRNPVGMGFEPTGGALWAAVNERDMLGENLVPDYITSVRENAFYGWPYSYYGQHVDARVKPQRPDLVAAAIAPDFAMGAHTASLGLAFYAGEAFPAHYRNGAFVGQHGSWNRSAYAGYKVVFVPFENGRPSGAVEDFLTGFLNARNEAQGRPVGVAVDAQGALLVADDVGGVIWRVAAGR